MAELFDYYQDQEKKKAQQTGLAQALTSGGTAPANDRADSNPYKTATNGNGTIPDPTPQPAPVNKAEAAPAAPAPVAAAPVAAPAPQPVAAAPQSVVPPQSPTGPNELFASMQKRMAAVQQGLPDPGNPDIYGYNQTLGVGALGGPGGPPAPVAAAPAAAPVPVDPHAAPAAYGASTDTNTGVHDLVQKLLENPASMSDQYVSQLKETNKEQATSFADQLAKKLKLNAASRGVSFSGNEAAHGEQIGEAMNADILKGNRDVDMMKASQDRQDLLNTIGVGQGYNQAAQGNYFTNQDQGRADRSLELQKQLGIGGLANDSARVGVAQAQQGEQSRQFDLSHALALKQFMEGQRQYNGQMGFNYNQLDQNGQMSALNQLAGLF